MSMVGIGGPRAPHHFEFHRRSNWAPWPFLGLDVLMSKSQRFWSSSSFNSKEHIWGDDVLAATADPYWHLPPHPHDVILRPSSVDFSKLSLVLMSRSLGKSYLVTSDESTYRPKNIPTRCKQFMSSDSYTYSAVFYPRAVALARLPMGLPAGPKRFQTMYPNRCISNHIICAISIETTFKIIYIYIFFKVSLLLIRQNF